MRYSQCNKSGVNRTGIAQNAKAVLGFSADECVSLSKNNWHILKELSTGRDIGTLYVADVDNAREPARTILEKLTLNLRRVQHFEYPFYFDLAPMRGTDAPLELPIKTIAMNWTSYYPCYEAQANVSERVALCSAALWSVAMANLQESHSSLASELQKRLKKVATPEAKTLRGYQQKVANQFEQRIGDCLSAAGFTTKTGVTDIAGVKLPSRSWRHRCLRSPHIKEEGNRDTCH